MNNWQRITSYALAGAFWLACIVLKHYIPDIDVAGLETACIGALGGLGVAHAKQVTG